MNGNCEVIVDGYEGDHRLFIRCDRDNLQDANDYASKKRIQLTGFGMNNKISVFQNGNFICNA